MHDHRDNDDERSRRRGPRTGIPRYLRWAETVILLVLLLVAYRYRPLSHLFGLEAFEQRHAWLDYAVLVAVWMLGKTVYYALFRRDQRRAELAAIREDIVQGRRKRMTLGARSILLLGMLALVCLGAFAGRQGADILPWAVPLFLLFALVELNTVLHPGDLLVPNPNDELLMFFKGRMLQAGYITAVLALACVYIVSLFAARYLTVLLPVVLTASLLVPGLVYRRLDRRADEDG